MLHIIIFIFKLSMYCKNNKKTYRIVVHLLHALCRLYIFLEMNVSTELGNYLTYALSPGLYSTIQSHLQQR